MKLERCMDMQQRARKVIPGMTHLLSKRPDMFSMGVWPGYYSKAKGAMVWDLDGNEYLDMSISGIGANVLGYADPDVDEAVFSALGNGISSSLNCPEEVELAECLCSLHPWADKVRLARTGGEAMAIAIRIARASRGRDTIAFCGYHGWHDWYLAANLQEDNALGEHLLPGLDPAGVPKALLGTAFPFKYNDLDGLKDIVARHGRTLAAIVMEPIRSARPEEGFIEGVHEIARETGAVLIVDEISAGFRLCPGGAHQVIGLNPDISVFSKALGNGYPIAAVIGKGEVMSAAQKTFISSTCWTERSGPTAALATIRKYVDLDVHVTLCERGDAVAKGWKEAAERHGLEISLGGIPPLSHFVFAGPDFLSKKALFVQEMLEQGILASNLYYAMYAHTEEHVDRYLQAVDHAFSVIAEAGESGDLEKRLKGEPTAAGFARLA